jgi:Mycoplasma protein of unknown function, DUF285
MRSRLGKRRPKGLQRLSQLRPWWWPIIPTVQILSFTISVVRAETASDATYAPRPPYGTLVIDEEANLNSTLVQIDDTNFKTLVHHCLKSHDKTACDSMAHWDVGRVTDCSWLFWEHNGEEWTLLRGADTFNVDLSAWDTRSCTTMQSMFNGAVAFDQPIGDWNVERVTDMSHM